MMSKIPVDIDHAKHSVGGAGGHWFRRGTHIATVSYTHLTLPTILIV